MQRLGAAEPGQQQPQSYGLAVQSQRRLRTFTALEYIRARARLGGLAVAMPIEGGERNEIQPLQSLITGITAQRVLSEVRCGDRGRVDRLLSAHRHDLSNCVEDARLDVSRCRLSRNPPCLGELLERNIEATHVGVGVTRDQACLLYTSP